MDGHAIVVRRLPGVPAARPRGRRNARPAGVRTRLGGCARKVGQVVLNVVFVAMIGCVMVMLVPALLGFQRYVILTGSMTGTYDRGSIVFDRPSPPHR